MLVTRLPSGLMAKGISLSTFGKRLSTTGTNGILTSRSGDIRIGEGDTTWQLTFHHDAETSQITQFSIANDYLEERITASGSQRDILPLRHQLPYGVGAKAIASSLAEYPLALLAGHRKRVIESHYDRPDAFFLNFLDRRHHLYSQGHFDAFTQDLEAASERKLERISQEFKSIDAKRILDVGCGWGGVTSYLASDFDVTALTLGKRSHSFTQTRLAEAHLTAEVLLCDILALDASEAFDGIVILGVLEHVPEYHRLFARLAKLTRPGSRIYIDGASSYSRLAMNPFIRKRIWQGSHGFVSLPALLKNAQRSHFKVIEMCNETSDYAATMGQWADRFVANKESIVNLTSESDYRAFEMYLFGGEESLLNGKLEAFHCILERQGE